MPGIVFVIDDDQAVRQSLCLVLGIGGYGTRSFASAEEFLNAHIADFSGCILTDLRMPGMSGLDLQSQLIERGIRLPIIFMTAYGSVAAARDALKKGAVDFLEKPLNEHELLQLVGETLAQHSVLEASQNRRQELRERLTLLTPRERNVLERIIAGRHNREIADELQISNRTVEVHKARLMAKLGITRLPDLLNLANLFASST